MEKPTGQPLFSVRNFRYRLQAKIVAAALATLIVLPGDVVAQPNAAAGRFRQIDGGAVVSRDAVRRLRWGSERVRVVVTLEGESTADVRARSADHSISEREHDAIEARSRDQHAAVEPAIRSHGGRVLGHLHDAVNGIKIEVARDRIAAISALPGVVSVLPVMKHRLHNTASVPFIGAPSVWQGTPGFRGEGMKIAIVDTGIDFTHADFGGPGTAAAFSAAAASSALPADPALFGPGAAKIKGGIDLVGDLYDSDKEGSVPVPDPNPLDCNGHGTHVGGTAAGFGVTASGATYFGPYDSAVYAEAFKIGPGVAPKADLYAVRVFGCEGSTDVVTEAIDWAMHNGMDVINMSLGSDFGTADTADALAARNAARAGVIVVASAGNAGPAPYIAGTPASGDAVLSVAAVDSIARFPAAKVQLASGVSIDAIDANGAPLPAGSLSVVVLRNPDGTVSRGCDETEYDDALIAGKLVVTVRGVCARVDRAKFGQTHGAAAVAMINTSAGFPPYEGTIQDVTIPFLGFRSVDAAVLTGTTSVALSDSTLNNPGFRSAATFSSGGPRGGDSFLSPSVTAPGVSILSALVGGGTEGALESGTSMAAPHVAGVAALVRQSHPGWPRRLLTAAIAQSGDPAQLADYAPRVEGSGLVQPVAATRTQAVVVGDGRERDALAFNFGFEELLRDYRDTRRMRVVNRGHDPIRFNVTVTQTGGAPHTARVNRSTLVVGGNGEEDLAVSLTVPAASVGATHDADGNPTFAEVAGYVTLTPASPTMNGGASLRVPYYFVPRARSNARYRIAGRFDPSRPTADLLASNGGGAIAASPDVYAWGLRSAPQRIPYFDIRAVGVQSNPISATDSILVFAINTHERFSALGSNGDFVAEMDILIDINGDDEPDFALIAVDNGVLTANAANGQVASALIDLKTGDATVNFLADAVNDGSTILLPVYASDLGLTPAAPRFSYTAQTYFPDGTAAPIRGTARFNAFSPSISAAAALPAIPPNGSAKVTVNIDPTEWATTPALGLMVVTQDNQAGAPQAALIDVRR